MLKLEKDLYTIKEVADMFGVTKPTVYDWMKNRGLGWIWLGARRRITKDAIESFLRSGNDGDLQEGYNRRKSRALSLVAELTTLQG